MPLKSTKLHRAKRLKNDEFYTQYQDIESECSNYLEHFFNKVIYCNCDTADSNFVKYFLNLKSQGLIKDILWSGGLNGLDFRSNISIELLKQSDIVVTNPPFSLFIPYINQLVKYNKQFLIMGNRNAVSYREVFELIKDNKLWIGTIPFGASMLFDVPEPEKLLIQGKENITYAIKDGIIKARVPATWFTNIHHKNMPKEIPLIKQYTGNETAYPKYDNFDAIEVKCKRNIPYDYMGIMGVPVTFIDRYNPQQFEILGLDKDFTYDGKSVRIGGKNLYTRIFIRRKCNMSEVSNDNRLLKTAV